MQLKYVAKCLSILKLTRSAEDFTELDSKNALVGRGIPSLPHLISHLPHPKQLFIGGRGIRGEGS